MIALHYTFHPQVSTAFSVRYAVRCCGLPPRSRSWAHAVGWTLHAVPAAIHDMRVGHRRVPMARQFL